MTNKLGQDRRGHCPNCGPEKWATIVGHYSHKHEHHEAPMTIYGEWFLLFCQACKDAYLVSQPSYSEDVPSHEDNFEQHFWEGTEIQWPKPYTWSRPSWLPLLKERDERLYAIFRELYVALDGDLKILASIAMRTVFDRASVLLGGPEISNFKEKLNSLLLSGLIGTSEHQTLSKLTEAGNAAAHRGWEPNSEELQQMLGILVPFIERNVIVGSSELSPPPRPTRNTRQLV
ncbi:DUF4145 domain-containing protein [Rhizobium skierniewicense]|uniref:DUF4145 domain-containing protein n=1 Tax=Rhizobium skierniewicense TaxID=984260 RepID=UPI001FAB847D|nr:DUF4145 domain-containing protein [Rhizobium skierniewicense]MCI9865824.1 DUF4145 domain-containing protein [Rhizobium skierniewicense]